MDADPLNMMQLSLQQRALKFMKSKLFGNIDLSRNEGRLKADIEGAMALAEKDLQLVLAAVPQLYSSRTDSERKEIYLGLGKQIGISAGEVHSPISLTRFLISSLSDEKDVKEEDPKLWAEDLVALKLLAKSKKAQFIRFATIVKQDILAEVETLNRQNMADIGVLPTFRGASTSVELRGVLRKEFVWGENVEDFEPEIESIRPIVSLAIQLDSGNPDRVAFQTDSKGLKYLIAELQAAEKAISELTKRLDPKR